MLFILLTCLARESFSFPVDKSNMGLLKLPPIPNRVQNSPKTGQTISSLRHFFIFFMELWSSSYAEEEGILIIIEPKKATICLQPHDRATAP